MLEIENAEHAKKMLAMKLLGVSGHQIAVTEVDQFNKPDVLSVTRSNKLIEYEIKLSRSDLMGELNSVKECKNEILLNNHNEHIQGSQQMQLGGKKMNVHFRGNIFEPDGLYENIGVAKKLMKHKRYLIPQSPRKSSVGFNSFTQPYRPNQFYFAVTHDLVELAKEVCQDIPYGVIDLNAIHGSSSIVLKAGWLHMEEPTSQEIFHMAHVLSFGYWRER